MLMTSADYRETLRRYRPRVFLDGGAVESVADEPRLAPGLNAVGITYDFAQRPELARLMTARQGSSGAIVNRMLHIHETADDLLAKLDAVRLVCAAVGCAQRYLAHDALAAILQATRRTDAAHGTGYHQRFLAYLHGVQAADLALGIAMTDAKGDRSKRPSLQVNCDVYVHIRERRRAVSSSAGRRPSSPAPPTCTSSWSCRAAAMPARTRRSPSAARCRWTRPA